ncbi:unnamed protein product [Spirodela intermedia]|uniref:BZIP domain-containing protein n=1 Tax=Spirodela intermedia TaxID=51605 RepID=A0ABN7EDH2_SPIIN|nr:unnamed protein product [Spirodela intermedia]
MQPGEVASLGYPLLERERMAMGRGAWRCRRSSSAGSSARRRRSPLPSPPPTPTRGTGSSGAWWWRSGGGGAMISNRESARRSRMRKQRHLDELQFQVSGLRSVNRRLIDQLNRAIADRDHTLLENSRLRGEVSGLQRRLQGGRRPPPSATPTPTNSTRRNTKNRTHLPTFFPEQYLLSLSLSNTIIL